MEILILALILLLMAFNTFLMVAIASFLIKSVESGGNTEIITKKEIPSSIPLDISEGDDMSEQMMNDQNPYNQGQKGRFDKGF